MQDRRQDLMDASRRSFHVYGKTEAGTNALGATRGAISSSARQLLILIDGKRSIDDLSKIFPQEILTPSLTLLESLNYIECLRHFPEPVEDRSDPIAPASERAGADAHENQPQAPTAPAPKSSTSRRRRSPSRGPGVAIALGVCCVAIFGSYWLVARRDAPIEVTAVPTNSVAPAPPAAPAPAPAPTSIAHGAPNPSEANTARTTQPAVVPQEEPIAVHRASVENAVRPSSAPASGNAAPSSGTEAVLSKTPVLHVRSQVTPQLPQLAKALGIVGGHVVVVLHVNPQGTVDRVELVSATPPQIYDQEMERAFAKWTFDPLGIPGRMTVEVEVAPPPTR